MRKVYLLIVISIFLCIGSSFLCDVLYLRSINHYENLFGKIANTYELNWNLLWEKLHSLEKFIFISFVIVYLRKWESIKQYFLETETNILFRVLIIYWLYSFADVTDRIVFNIYEFQLNDWIIHLYNFIYIIKTSYLCRKK